MNHSCALQRAADGRWDYTCNRRPCGYCREYTPIPEDAGWLPPESIRAYNTKLEAFKANFHTDGHATEEEACECYKRFLLDTELRLNPTEPENANQQNRCEVCKKFTACHAWCGTYRTFCLCPEHQTREAVEKLLTVGESWES